MEVHTVCVHSHLHEVWSISVLSGQAATVHDVLVGAEVLSTIAAIVTVLPRAIHEGLLTELHQQPVLQEWGRGRGERGRGGGRKGGEGGGERGRGGGRKGGEGGGERGRGGGRKGEEGEKGG